MQIQSNQQMSIINNRQTPQFKSAYPVYHWVAGESGKYAPVVTEELTRKLQRKLIGILNKSVVKTSPKLTLLKERLTKYLSDIDVDFRQNPIVRSFYSHKMPEHRMLKEAISYLISGKDIKIFEDNFAKDIGRYKADAPYSAELNDALDTYKKSGMYYVGEKAKKFKINGEKVALHTKFKEIKNRKGKTIDYQLLDIRFCPDKGTETPIYRYYKIQKEK